MGSGGGQEGVRNTLPVGPGVRVASGAVRSAPRRWSPPAPPPRTAASTPPAPPAPAARDSRPFRGELIFSAKMAHQGLNGQFSSCICSDGE
eukprot:6854656-Pyramimonas_sp.AAC.1